MRNPYWARMMKEYLFSKREAIFHFPWHDPEAVRRTDMMGVCILHESLDRFEEVTGYSREKLPLHELYEYSFMLALASELDLKLEKRDKCISTLLEGIKHLIAHHDLSPEAVGKLQTLVATNLFSDDKREARVLN